MLQSSSERVVGAAYVDEVGEWCDVGLEVADVVCGAWEAVNEECGWEVSIDGALLLCHTLHFLCEQLDSDDAGQYDTGVDGGLDSGRPFRF